MNKMDGRQIRVFISSTFRDMQEERERLTKFIFPQVRKLCESRNVTFSEVDLRWGITDELKAEGKVLPLCLEEIQRCRPYFICFLGERYGWIPDEIPQELIEKEPWLVEHKHHSVTELEILHGVLNNPAMAGNALFYFRKPTYLSSISKDKRADFEEIATPDEIQQYGMNEAQRRADERRKKLSLLKERIRSYTNQIVDYTDPTNLGDRVLNDLIKLINNKYPDNEKIDSLALQRFEHEAFSRRKQSVYISHSKNFSKLNAHILGAGGPLVITGVSGLGKSALIANWIVDFKKRNPGVFIIEHYIGASADSADWKAMLTRIMQELKGKFSIKIDIPWEINALRREFAVCLHRKEINCQVVITIDGLNQLEDHDGALDLVWLPTSFPSNIHCIVSTLAGRPLAELEKRNIPSLKIEPLSPAERRELIISFLIQYAKHLSEALLTRIADAPLSVNPLYLRVLLEELRLHGKHETLSNLIEEYLNATSIEDLFQLILSRYEKDYEADYPGLVRKVLCAIWASRRGLSEAEILDIAGDRDAPLPHVFWSPLYLAVEQSLVNSNGRISFSHAYFKNAVKSRYLLKKEDIRAEHTRLAEYFSSLEHSQRRTDELPYQYMKAKSWESLNNLLSEANFYLSAWNTNEFDVRSYWAQIETNSHYRMIDTYKYILEAPQKYNEVVWKLVHHFQSAGHHCEAGQLLEYLARKYRNEGETDTLQAVLMDQATGLARQGKPREALLALEQAERICRNSENRDALKKVLGNKGMLLIDLNEYDAAIRSLDEAERLAVEACDHNVLHSVKNSQAVLYQIRGDYAKAIKIYQEVEDICKATGDVAGLATVYSNQGSFYKVQGKYDQALFLLQKAEQSCREIGYPRGLAIAVGALSDILEVKGKLQQALEKINEQKTICKQINDRAIYGTALYKEAMIYNVQGKNHDAFELLREAESIYRDLSDRNGLASCLSALGSIHYAFEQHQESLKALDESEQISRELRLKEVLQVVLGNKAMIYRAQGKVDRAIMLYEEKAAICRETGNKKSLANCLGNLANCYIALSQLDKALELHKEKESISISLGNKKSLANSLGNQACIMLMQDKNDEALVLLRHQEEIAREIGSVEDLCQSLQNQVIILAETEQSRALRIGKEALALQIGIAVAQTDQGKALGQSLQRRHHIRKTFDFVACRIERGVGSFDMSFVIAVRVQRAAQTQAALRTEIMRQVRIVAGYAFTQHAHLGNRPCRSRTRAMRQQPVVQALIGTFNDRYNRPQRIVQIQTDGGKMHFVAG